MILKNFLIQSDFNIWKINFTSCTIWQHMLTLYMYTCIHCNSCIAKEDSYLQTDTTSRLQICIQQYGIIWHQETLIGKSRGLASNHQQLSPSSISASRISRYSGRCPDIFCQITRQETQGPVRDPRAHHPHQNGGSPQDQLTASTWDYLAFIYWHNANNCDLYLCPLNSCCGNFPCQSSSL